MTTLLTWTTKQKDSTLFHQLQKREGNTIPV